MADAKGNTFENDLLKLLFNVVAIADIAQNHATPATKYWLGLHTGTLDDTASQSTNEAAYGAYARASVVRTTAGWKVTGNTAYLKAAIDFPAATSGSSTVTYFTVGTASTGAGKVLYYGTVSPNLSVVTGVTPRLTTASNIQET